MQEKRGKTMIVAEVEVPQQIGQAEVYGGGGLAGRLLEQVAVSFEDVASQVQKFVDAGLASHLRPTKGGPAETELEFGIKINADGNVVLARTGADVHLTLKVRWNRE